MPATLVLGDVPCLSSRARFFLAGGVRDESSVDGVADAALQRPQRVLLALILGEFAQVVVAAGGVMRPLGHGGDVDGVIEHSVAAAVDAVTCARSAGRLTGCGAVVAGVVIR